MTTESCKEPMMTEVVDDVRDRGTRSSMSNRRKSPLCSGGRALVSTGCSNGLKRFNADEMNHEILADRCRRHDPDRFAVLCRMHLLFLLDLSYHEFDSNPLASPTSGECTSASSSSTSSSSSSSRLRRGLSATIQRPRSRTDASTVSRPVDGNILQTKECVSCLHQIMDFLSREENLLQEGLFRKSGKKSRQQELYNSISSGTSLNLSLDCPYNAHDCASVLKMFLADLSEPLLTEAHYPVHCQIACLRGCDKEKSSSDRQVQSLQLIFLLMPMANRNLLRRLLTLLHRVTLVCNVNRMNAVNLAIMFAPHILCPRKMAPEELCRKSGVLTSAVAFMIERAPQLFLPPAALIRDLQVFNDAKDEAVRTTITFCERRGLRDEPEVNGQCVGAVNDTTAVALAQLYAHVQSMPESLKKRQLIKQFNKENKKGTPAATATATQPLKPRRHRNKSLRQSLKKRLFGRSQRRHATVHPITVCSKSDLKAVPSCKQRIKLDHAQTEAVLDGVQVDTIRHPAYCRNSANLEALRAAVASSTRSANSREQGTNRARMVADQRQPSSSSLVFYRKNPSLLAVSCEPLSVTNGVSDRSDPGLIRESSSWAVRKVFIVRETSL